MSDELRGLEMPSGDAMSVANYIVGALSLVKDEGSFIDVGGGFSARDLWVKIEGKTFFVTVKEAG